MSETIIVALISLFGTLGGTFGGIITSSKLTNYRIEQLEKRVEKHNHLVERTYELEEKIQLHEEKIKVANHRIDDLEKINKGEFYE
ncbi:MAG: hypothetical protein UHM85_06215 [Acutalibacteraceae bacterium]|nr:hypothetical protein [Acutalibacteraceae bacterium]